MFAKDLQIGQRFQIKQSSRWSNNFRIVEIIKFDELSNMLIKTTTGRQVLLDKNDEVRLAG